MTGQSYEPAPPGLRTVLGSPVAVGIAVYALGAAAVQLAPMGTPVAAWWPAAGVAVAAVTLSTGRHRMLVLLTVLLAGLAANLTGGRGPLVSVAFAVANTVEAAVAGALLTRRGAPALRTVPDLARLFAAAAVGAALAGAIAAGTVGVLVGGVPWTVWWAVAAGHGAAVVVLVPLVMILPGRAGTVRTAEVVALWAAVVAATVTVFSLPLPLAFVPVAVLVGTGLRLGVRTAAAQLIVVGVLVATLSALGSGPFAIAGRLVGPGATGALVAGFLAACALVVLALAISVAQREQALRALADQRLFERALLEVVDAGVLACDAEGAIVVRNRAHRRVTGVGEDEHVEPEQLMRRLEVTEGGVPVPPDRTPLRRALAGEVLSDVEMRMGPAGGPGSEIVTMARPIHGPDGRLLGAVAAFTDVTDERAVQARLRDSLAFRDAVLAASPDVIFILDTRTQATLWLSRSLTDLLGHRPEDVIALGGEVASALVHPDDVDRVHAVDAAACLVGDGEVRKLRLRALHSDGSYRWISRRVTPFARAADGTVTQLLGVARDVTENVALEERLAAAALHDPLTGLPNRRLLTDRLGIALRRSARAPVPVLFCDLDGFKHVNDTAGHAAGDVVLRTTATRLLGVLRPQDTVARVGGDEFVCVLDAAPHAMPTDLSATEVRREAHDVAHRIVTAVAEPVEIDGVAFRVSVSIGMTFARAGDDPEATLRDADRAMYRAKVRGKGRHEEFDGSRPRPAGTAV
jgi:diguanylate cyclase (GGDEF)-like protein/PAS domain S-box-containing protein